MQDSIPKGWWEEKANNQIIGMEFLNLNERIPNNKRGISKWGHFSLRNAPHFPLSSEHLLALFLSLYSNISIKLQLTHKSSN